MSRPALADGAGPGGPAGGAGRARLRQVWPGTGRVDRPDDVAAVLAGVRDAALARSATSESLTVVGRGTDVVHGGTVDPRHALAVPAELEPVLGGGLRRGSVVAAAGSGSLLLSLIGAAQGAGAWSAVMGWPGFGASAAAEFAVDLARTALVPDPGGDWVRIAGILAAGVDLLVLRPPATLPDGVAGRLRARARQHGCVLLVVAPAGGVRVWPGPDVVLEAVRHRWHGLGAGRGRLRHHEVQIGVSGRRARPAAPVWVPMPPPSLAAVAAGRLGGVPDFGLPADWPAGRRAPGGVTPVLRPRPAPEPPDDPWADHLVSEAAWAARGSRTA